MTAMAAEELHDSGFALQRRHVHIEVHPVDALQFERHVLVQDFGYGFVVRSFPAPVRLRSFGINRHFGGHIIGKNCMQFFTVDRSHFPDYPLQLKRKRYISSVRGEASLAHHAPFPHPADRTGQAHFAHPALGERLTRSHTESCGSVPSGD